MTDWDQVPVAALAGFRNGYAFKPEHQGSVGRPIVRIEQFLNPDVEPARYEGDDIPERNHIKAGDLVFSWSGTLAVGTWDREPAYLNQHLFRVDPCPGVDPRWLRWSLVEAIERMTPWMHGSAMTHITRRVLEEVRVPVPPLETQRRIADHLETETARIDTLITKNQRAAALVEERMARSVEQRLLAAAEGIQAGPLRYVVRSVVQGWSPQCDSTAADGVTQWGVLKAGACNGGVFRPEQNKALPGDFDPRPDLVVERGDLVVSRANTRELVGSSAVVDGDYPRLMLCDKLYALRLDRRRALPSFVAATLGATEHRRLIELDASGSSPSMQNISREQILQLPIALPPLAAQRDAMTSIELERDRVRDLLQLLAQQGTLLRERRQALITAAVTGEIEV